jgi:hypothetical protein
MTFSGSLAFLHMFIPYFTGRGRSHGSLLMQAVADLLKEGSEGLRVVMLR